ncbi:MAG: GIY-YIG nuclease family protein [Candidatus Binataceae bacterium]
MVVKKPRRTYYVYMMASPSQTLYTGVTNDLERRVAEHQSGAGSEFVSRYRVTQLVYFEEFRYINAAIEREKQIKGLLRKKKIALVDSMNPAWKDLSVAERDRDSSLRRLRSE